MVGVSLMADSMLGLVRLQMEDVIRFERQHVRLCLIGMANLLISTRIKDRIVDQMFAVEKSVLRKQSLPLPCEMIVHFNVTLAELQQGRDIVASRLISVV